MGRTFSGIARPDRRYRFGRRRVCIRIERNAGDYISVSDLFQENAFTKVGSREEIRKTIRNIHEHYAEVVANSPAFVNSPIPVDFSHLPPQPFNPLEKE